MADSVLFCSVLFVCSLCVFLYLYPLLRITFFLHVQAIAFLFLLLSSLVHFLLPFLSLVTGCSLGLITIIGHLSI